MKSINKVLIFGLNVILSCVILAMVYSLLYSKIEIKLGKRNAVYEDFYKVDEKLKNFETLRTKIDEQKGVILEDIRAYQDYLYSNDQNSAAYLKRVTNVLNKVGISIKEKQKNGFVGNAMIKQKNGAFQIDLTADYEQMCRLLFELEKFSVIQEIKVDYKHNVSLKCVPVQYSKDIDDYFNDKVTTKNTKKDSLEAVNYFEDVFDRTQKMKKNLGIIPKWEDFKPLPRTPFYKYEIKMAAKSAKGKYYGGNAPLISMDGIMYDTVDPIVIIGGKFYHLGDYYKGARIIKVNQSSILVDYYGRIHSYRMKY